jgi:hypothetical protein
MNFFLTVSHVHIFTVLVEFIRKTHLISIICTNTHAQGQTSRPSRTKRDTMPEDLLVGGK